MPVTGEHLPPATRAFYRRAIRLLDDAGVPFLVGGAYAFERYTGIARHTKDLDVFVHPRDFERGLALFRGAGYATRVSFPHWLGKAYSGDDFVDVIFSSGNGVAAVDDDWFRHAVDAEVLGMPVRLSPAEEMIWSKAFIMERERFDGADVAHILRARAEALDWDRLQRRFQGHWRVLLAHLVMFGFIYPCERHRVPAAVMRALAARLDDEVDEPAEERLCQGTLVSRAQYLVDVDEWGYADARVAPRGNLTRRETAIWTAAIAEDGPAAAPPPGDAREAA
ncbi:MAG TPA: hypothetical protein VFX28_15025 [Methylomirabilota bacterium]|nr:hypothetical protein [Methylomirabilota bacterium]